MDKSRNPANKIRAKGRALPPPGDFIALGSKSRTVSSDSDLKPLQPLARKPSSSSTSLPSSSLTNTGIKDKRRDIPVPLSLHPPGLQKQGKLPPVLFSPTPQKPRESPLGRRNLDNESPGPTVVLIDSNPLELESNVMEASAQGQLEQVEGLLCGALKALKVNRLKPDPLIYLSLIGLAKTKPSMFQLKAVIEHLLMFLKRETSNTAVKPKPNPLLTSMACNILTHAFESEDNWPQSFVKVFVDDAVGDRSWVDNEHCKTFVDNIITAFGTVLPSKPATATAEQPRKDSQTTTASIADMIVKPRSTDEEQFLEEFGITVTADEPMSVLPRYASPTMESAVQYYIQDVVKDQLTKRQMIDGVSRNMLRFLTSVCGYSEVRLIASQKIEAWLQNPKLTRPAQELLMSVAMNCNTHTNEDIEVVGNLVKMRLKPKPLANHYITCIKELVNQHPDNLGTTLKHVIYNELGQQRNPNNMAVLQVIFQIEPENAAKYLALVFQDLLANREDYLKPLKSLFREIVRILRYEINFVAFCRGLMQERNDNFLADLDQNVKNRIFSALVSLVSMSMLTSVSPVVKEIAVAMGRGEKRDLSVLQEFQTQISLIQRDAVWWFHTKVIPMFNPSEKEYVSCLNKVLFLETNESYQSKDSWPSENEIVFLLSLVRDVPLTEDALLRLLLLGLSDDFPMNCADALDVIERLARRSAVLRTGLPGLEIERQKVIEMILSLCVYAHPKEIALPRGYQPPQLAIGNLYWKGWTILLILAACNPMTIGVPVWQSYPTSRCMMEMIITRNYNFPPLATGESSIDEIKSTELQLSRAEKDDILAFESHLAAATTGKTISEENSLLINQLISLDPSGPPRQPPKAVIEHMKMLDKSLGLDYMFCKSRNPDFLLDIIHSQGSTRSMPWLAELVESSESSLNVLPSQCLCEFLLMKDGKPKPHKKPSVSHDKKSVHDRVVERLQSLLKGDETTMVSTLEIMEYFLNRLQSNDMKERDNAVKAMKAILKLSQTPVNDQSMDVDVEESRTDVLFPDYLWFLKEIPKLEHFKALLPSIVLTFRQAMYGEMDIGRLQAYTLFISHHIDELTKEQLDELTEDISQLVTTRGTLLNGLVNSETPQGVETYNALLGIYTKALDKSMDKSEFNLQWSDNQEKVYVSWSEETIHPNMSANLHVRVVHAAIVLLTCGPSDESGNNMKYKLLLDTWFPEKGHFEVRLADTGEEAILLQDWLRMKMVTSNVSRLVDTALRGLKPGQLVLFIQAFGLPVASVSKLLKCLDEAAFEEPVAFSQAVVDRDYLFQLVEVQWARGATGGEKLCEFLGQDNATVKQEPVDLSVLEEAMTPFPVQISSPEYKKEEIRRPTIFSEDSLEQLLLKVYFEEKAKKETMEAFSELKKNLAVAAVCSSKDRTINKTLLSALKEILSSEIKEKFIDSMYMKPDVTCSIIGLLARIKDDSEGIQRSLFTEIIKILRSKKEEGSKVDTHLKIVCQEFGIKEESEERLSETENEITALMTSFNKKDNSKANIQALSVRIAHLLMKGVRSGTITPDNLNLELLLETCNAMQERGLPVLQKVLDAVCNCFIESSYKTTEASFDNIQSCVRFLVDVYKHGQGQGNQFSSGIVLDWLEILDPEIVHVDPLLQRELLFMDRDEAVSNKGIDRSKTPASYLQALLAHQSKGNALHDCLDWLLSIDAVSARLNPTAALDLISSVVHNPKLWQGRDSKQNNLDEDKGRRINDEVMLELAAPQICKLVDLILAEMEMNYHSGAESETSSSPQKADNEKIRPQSSTNVVKIAEKRLPLLLNHIKNLNVKMMDRVSSTIKRQKKFPKSVINCLLQQIYVQKPNLIGLPKHEMLTKESADIILQAENSPTDDVIHRMMLSISNTLPHGSWETEFHNLILVCRRLAFKHPFLVLRHLSTFMSSLQGRHRIGPSDFKRANQIILYTQVLSLLDLLRPFIFIKNQVSQEGLSKTIDVFMDLIQSFCLQGAEAAAIVTKFVEFLNQFVAYDSSYAFSILSKYQMTFKDLFYDHPGFDGLKFLCTFLSVSDDDPSDTTDKILSAPVVPSIATPWTGRQLVPIRQKLAEGHQPDVVITVLNDLDETSKRRVDILQHFVDDLICLLKSEFSEIRDKSHNLLLRHYRQQPRESKVLVDSYVSCVQSDSQEVALSAAKFVPQLILLADDGCLDLLQKLFVASITSRPESREFISKAIKNLSIDF